MAHLLIRKTSLLLLCLSALAWLVSCGRNDSFEAYFAEHRGEYATFTVEQETMGGVVAAAKAWNERPENKKKGPVVLRFNLDQPADIVFYALMAVGETGRTILVAEGDGGEVIIPMQLCTGMGGWGPGGEMGPAPENPLLFDMSMDGRVCMCSVITMLENGEIMLNEDRLMDTPARRPGKISRYNSQKLDEYIKGPQRAASDNQMDFKLYLSLQKKADLRDILALFRTLQQHKGLKLGFYVPPADDGPDFEEYFKEHRTEYTTDAMEPGRPFALVVYLHEPTFRLRDMLKAETENKLILLAKTDDGGVIIPVVPAETREKTGWGPRGEEIRPPKAPLCISNAHLCQRVPILSLTLNKDGQVWDNTNQTELAPPPTRKSGQLSLYDDRRLDAALFEHQQQRHAEDNSPIVVLNVDTYAADMRDYLALLQILRKYEDLGTSN